MKILKNISSNKRSTIALVEFENKYYVCKIFKDMKMYQNEYIFYEKIKNTKISNYVSFEKATPNFIFFEYNEDIVDLYEFLIKNNNVLNVIIKNLLKLIQKLHKLNIVHRDIKPENFIINKKTLQIFLIDFEFAVDKFFKELDYSGTVYYCDPIYYITCFHKASNNLCVKIMII